MARPHNSADGFEAALQARGRPVVVLRLYVAGGTAASLRAVSNLRAICKDYLQGCHELEVIDVYHNAAALRRDQVVAVPTLVKVAPLPVRRVVGDLSNLGRVLVSLNIQPKAPGDGAKAQKARR